MSMTWEVINLAIPAWLKRMYGATNAPGGVRRMLIPRCSRRGDSDLGRVDTGIDGFDDYDVGLNTDDGLIPEEQARSKRVRVAPADSPATRSRRPA